MKGEWFEWNCEKKQERMIMGRVMQVVQKERKMSDAREDKRREERRREKNEARVR